MKCEYGCSSEGPDDKCGNCGHPKKNHLNLHPHICEGVYDKDRVHVVTSCRCAGFTRENPNAGTGI
jgi:hypothetical protein